MKTDAIRWNHWEALRCLGGDCELILGVSAGPRILSFRRCGGPNLLYRDTTDFRVGDWRLYGGHRFTVAPEGDDSYAPDNDPCVVLAGEHDVRVTAPTGPGGTQRVLMIRESRDGAGFDLDHLLVNRSDRSWRGALWAITCVPHTSTVVAPRGNAKLRCWPGSGADQWQVAPRHFAMTPDGSRAKVGWHCPAGWLASLQPGGTFVIHCPSTPAPADCVDDGCNLEVFTCPDYVELETLSGLITLAPGEKAIHRQRWRLLAPTFVPTDWAAIAQAAGCVSSEQEYHYAL